MFPDVGIEIPNTPEVPSHTSTRSQIKQVIEKEQSIQGDLQACIDKLLMLKETLGEKIQSTVIKK